MSFESNPPKGWYPDPELPGGERYWDGFAWTEARRSTSPQDGAGGFMPPPPPIPPQQPGIPPAFGATGTHYEATQAGWALGLSIVGFCCFILSIVGMVLAILELNAINAGRRDPKNKGLANGAIVVAVLVILFNIVSVFANFALTTNGF